MDPESLSSNNSEGPGIVCMNRSVTSRVSNNTLYNARLAPTSPGIAQKGP